MHCDGICEYLSLSLSCLKVCVRLLFLFLSVEVCSTRSSSSIGQDSLPYPRDALLARVLGMVLCLSVCLSVCVRQSQVGVLSKPAKRIGLVLVWELISTYPTVF